MCLCVAVVFPTTNLKGNTKFITKAVLCITSGYYYGKAVSQRLHGRAIAQPWQCGRCGRRYQQHCSLIRHRRHCEGRCHLACTLCGAMFYRRDLLRRHTWSVHDVTTPYVAPAFVASSQSDQHGVGEGMRSNWRLPLSFFTLYS